MEIKSLVGGDDGNPYDMDHMYLSFEKKVTTVEYGY